MIYIYNLNDNNKNIFSEILQVGYGKGKMYAELTTIS